MAEILRINQDILEDSKNGNDQALKQQLEKCGTATKKKTVRGN